MSTTEAGPIILDDEVDKPFTIPACADPSEAALLQWAHDHPIDKPRPPIDGGRYVLDDPATGDTRPQWSRPRSGPDGAPAFWGPGAGRFRLGASGRLGVEVALDSLQLSRSRTLG